MQEYIKQRVLDVALFTIQNQSTVRETAKRFGVSKSTIHKDLQERLPKINYDLYQDVVKIIKTNKEEKHIRGGNATRKKYKKLNKEVEAI